MNYEFNLLDHVGLVALLANTAGGGGGDDNNTSSPTGRGVNKNPAVLNIIESYSLHQTEVDINMIKAMGHACKTVIKTNIYFPPKLL